MANYFSSLRSNPAYGDYSDDEIAVAIRSLKPEYQDFSNDEIGQAADEVGFTFDELSSARVEEDKPWYSDAYETGRQIGAGAVVDLPRMAGQAMQALSPEESVISEAGRGLVQGAEARAPGWAPDMAGRGPVAEAFIGGGRSLAPSAATMLAYANPFGEITGPLATVALFGGSQYKEEYEKVKAAGGTDAEANQAGLLTGAIQGGGEVIANRFGLGMFGANKKLIAEGVNGLIGRAVDTSVLKPWAKAAGAAMIGEPATEVAQDIGTAAVERKYGLETQGYGDIAKQSFGAAAAMTAMLAPFGLVGHYKNAQRAEAIDNILADPNAAPQNERAAVVSMLYSDAKKNGIQGADIWFNGALDDIKANNPIRRDATSQAESERPIAEKVMSAENVDDAIAAAAAAASESTPPPGGGIINRVLSPAQPLDRFAGTVADQGAARQSEINAAIPARAEGPQVSPALRQQTTPVGPVRQGVIDALAPDESAYPGGTWVEPDMPTGGAPVKAAPPLALPNLPPDPMVVFKDGTVARAGEVESEIARLEQANETEAAANLRARLAGYPGGQPTQNAEQMSSRSMPPENGGPRTTEPTPSVAAEISTEIPPTFEPAAPETHARVEQVAETAPVAEQSRPGDSWVIRNKETGEVIMETFDRKKVDALNTAKYEAVPALRHLQEFNRKVREQAPAKPNILKSKSERARDERETRLAGKKPLTAAQQKAAADRQKRATTVNPAKDSLFAAIAKLGGLSRTEAEKQGIDPANFKTPGYGIKRVYAPNGGTFDGMAERLSEMGYPVRDEAGKYNPNTLLEKLIEAHSGKTVGAQQYLEAEIVRDADNREEPPADVMESLADVVDEVRPSEAVSRLAEAIVRAKAAIGDQATQTILDDAEYTFTGTDETADLLEQAIDEARAEQRDSGSEGAGEGSRATGESETAKAEVAAEEVTAPAKPSKAKGAFTFKINPVNGGFVIESDNGGGIVLAGKPSGFGILDSTQPRVFKTEAEARLYAKSKKMALESDVSPATQGAPTDLFGAAPVKEQALADAKRAKDEKLSGTRDVPMDAAPGTLFNQGQADIEDSASRDNVQPMTTDQGSGDNLTDTKPLEPESEVSRRLFGPKAKIKNGYVTLYHGSGSVIDGAPSVDRAGSGTEGWGVYFSVAKNNSRVFGDHITETRLPLALLDQIIDYEAPLSKQSEYVKKQLSDFALSPSSASDTQLKYAYQNWHNDYLRRKGRVGNTTQEWENELHKTAGWGEDIAVVRSALINNDLVARQVLGGNGDPTGYEIYENLSRRYARKERNASEFLLGRGIIGASFSSGRDLHAADRSTRNLILWDQDTIDGKGEKVWLGEENPNPPQRTQGAETPEQPATEDQPTPEAKEPAVAIAAENYTLEAHDEIFKRVHDGDMTAAEFKASFEAFVQNREAIARELGGMTKAAMFRIFGRNFEWRNKNDKKDDVVRAAVSSMTTDYVLGDSLSYGMGKDSMLNAVRALVAKTTDESLAEYANTRKAKTEEFEAEVKEKIKGAKDPKTIEDFQRAIRLKMGDGLSFADARMALTVEQRATFDRMLGEKTRTERGDRKMADRPRVSAAGATTGAEIIATKHTKKGHDLYVVQTAERVERDVYNEWNATAKKLGGYYSSFRGGGAIPGFQFTTREGAEAFKAYVSEGDTTAVREQAMARRDAFEDDRSQSAVERLREMADKLDARADESLGQERKANTDRRARMAASAEAAANGGKATAATMRNIADAIEKGEVKFLDKVRQKVQIESLEGYIRAAKNEENRKKYPAYGEQEKHKYDPATEETADYTEWPTYTMYRSDLANLGRAISEVEGLKKAGKSILSVADDVTDAYLKFARENIHRVSTFKTTNGDRAAFKSKGDAEAAIARSGYKGKAVVLPFKRGENLIILSPSEAQRLGIWTGDNDKRISLQAEFAADLVEKMGRRKHNGVTVPWQLETAHIRRKRLDAMGIESPAEFRSALREFIALQQPEKAPDKIKEMERAMIGRKNDGLDFFPTPASVADQMIEAAGIEEGMSVLEPSAGMGHIAERIRAAGVDPDVAEFSGDRRELLEAKGFRVVGTDFMAIKPREFFTYGDVFKTPDGQEGIMRGSGGLGSNRVGLVNSEGVKHWVDRDTLIGVRKNGTESGYDRIIMNPPFSDRRDAEHVKHAYELLKPGGRLVAIMGEGVFFGSDKSATEFRDWLESVGATDEKLPEGTFMDASLPVNTGVNARMVVIEKETDTGQPLYSRNNPFGAMHDQANRDEALDPLPDEAAFVQSGIEGKTPKDAARFIIKNGGKDQALIAERILLQLGRLEKAGVKLDMKFAHLGDSVPSALIPARGLTDWRFNKGDNKITVWINGADVTGKVGASYETVLHELVHMATVGVVHLGNLKAAEGTKTAADVKDLYAVSNHIIKHFNNRVSDSKSGKVQLTAFEQRIYARANNAFADPDETLAWALSNPEAQAYLETIPYPKHKSAWSAFVTAVRKLLGISEKSETALSEVLRVAENLMSYNVNDLLGLDTIDGQNTAIQSASGSGQLPQISRRAQTDTEVESIKSLNAALAAERGANWSNAYALDNIGSARQDVASAIKSVFGVSIVGIRATTKEGAEIPAMQHGGTLFINTESGRYGFVQLAGHELLHDLRENRPDIYDWFAGIARNYSAAGAEAHYRGRLEATGDDITNVDIQEEMLADFVGDSLANPDFLDALAKHNKSKFRILVNYIAKWLGDVASKLTKNGFGSSEYFNDVRGLQSYLIGALDAYKRGDTAQSVEPPKYRRKLPEDASPSESYISRTVDNLIYNYQDRFTDLKKLQKTRKPLSEASDAVLAEERYAGMVSARVQDFHQDMRDPLIKAIHNAKLEYSEVEDYLDAKDAPDRNRAMREINPTQSEIDAKRAALTAIRDRLANEEPVSKYVRLRSKLRQAEADVEDGIVDDSLVDILKRDIAKARKDADVKAYVAATEGLAALRLAKAYEGDNTALSGTSDADAAAVIRKAKDEGKFDAMEQISALVDAITAKTRQTWVTGGLMTQDEVDALNEKYPHYVPRHREEVGGENPAVGKGYNIRGKETKRATGSTRNVVDILAHIVAQHETAIIRSEKNKVDQALYEFAKENPDPDLWEVDTAEMTRMVDPVSGTVKNVVSPTYKQRDNVLTFKIEGKEHTIIFNERNEAMVRLAAAIKNLSASELGEVTQLVGTFTRFLATMNTSANPVFTATNFLRDIQTAWINLSSTELADYKGDVFKAIPKSVRAIWQMSRGKTDTEITRFAREFRDAGGMTGWLDHYKNIETRAKALQKQLAEMGPGKLNFTKRLAHQYWTVIEDANTAVENGVRLAIYMAARKRGLSVGKSASLAKNTTINFNRKGAKGVEFNMWYMFANASIQGTQNIVSRMGNKRVQYILYGLVAAGFLMDVLARSMAGDDDDDGQNDYDQLPEYTKAVKYVLMFGSQPITLPMPYGFNFFHSIGRKASEMMFRPDTSPAKAAMDMAGIFMGAFSPVGSSNSITQFIAPTIADPLVQWAENKTFAGNPLRREQFPFGPPKPEYQLGFKSTSAPAKWITEVLNNVSGGNEVRPGAIDMNPAVIDHAITSVLGGMGRTYLQAFSGPIKLATGQEIKAKEIPFVNIFAGSRPEYQTESKFYDNLREIETTERELKYYKGDIKKIAEIRKENAAHIKVLPITKAIEKRLKKLREQEKAIEKKDPDGSKARLQLIEMQKRLLMAKFNKALQAAQQ